ncbi:DNA-binding anti-repressor SinI [Bacillus testis]|uniref:DNA-binding anti-repressor SinI n=1 Tax=Bacillus testis TaxID=1622072 RepID=UPI000ADF1718|nr:DNA-binding anti-repressor SinI [Bacillus testis]
MVEERKERNMYDSEWLELMKAARDTGVTKSQVLAFIKEQPQRIMNERNEQRPK